MGAAVLVAPCEAPRPATHHRASVCLPKSTALVVSGLSSLHDGHMLWSLSRGSRNPCLVRLCVQVSRTYPREDAYKPLHKGWKNVMEQVKDFFTGEHAPATARAM